MLVSCTASTSTKKDVFDKHVPYTTEYYGSGEVYKRCQFVESVKNGYCYVYFKDGHKFSKGAYKNGIPYGLLTSYYKSGEIHALR